MSPAVPRHVLAAGATVSLGLSLALPSFVRHPPTLPFTLSSVICLGALLVLERRRPHLGRSVVLVLVLGLLAVAVLSPPRRSRDLWQYAMYGRMVAVHHASPYEHVPFEFRHDPAYPRIDRIWRHTPSLYGPGFTLASAGIAQVVGTSRLPTRLAYQGLAALAVGAAALLIDRRARDPMAVLIFVANPAIAGWTVNGGHNDALVGVALFGAVLLAERRRLLWAGALIGLAALVKVVAALVLIPLGWWLWRRHGRRLVVPLALAAGTASVTALGFIVGGGMAAVDKLHKAAAGTSWSSFWRSAVDITATRNTHELPPAIGLVAVALVGALVVLFAWARIDDATPHLLVASGLVAYLLGAPYTLIWYLAWVLPLLCLHWRSHLTSLVLAFSAIELVAAEQVRGAVPSTVSNALGIAVHGLQVFEVLALLALAIHAIRTIRRRSSGAPPGGLPGGSGRGVVPATPIALTRSHSVGRVSN